MPATYRGAVRPPFIEARPQEEQSEATNSTIGGQSAPPSLKPRLARISRHQDGLSGGSPPPLH